MRCCVVLLGGLPLLFLEPARGMDTPAEDQKVVQAVGLGADGPALLDYFRKHTVPEADPNKVKQLIGRLGNDEFRVREKAQAELLALGAGALADIKQAENVRDTETRRRAGEVRRFIETKAEPAVQRASARLLARLKPAGTTDVLLAFLPYASDSSVVDELITALGAVASRDREAEPQLVRALADKRPVKRGAAAEVLAGAKIHLPEVRKLLKDPEPTVRLRTGMALLHLREKDALPPLVDVLGDLPPEQLWPVEEILCRLAGDKAPAVSLGNSEASRKACRDAWAAWLTRNKDKIDLAKVDFSKTALGYTLVVEQPANRLGNGVVLELDGKRAVRWSFPVPTYPVDAQIVADDRVLVAEYRAQQVTERDFKGKVVWQKQVSGFPIGVQRLADGHTLVLLQQNRLLEFDRQGNETYNYVGPPMYRARKLPGGDIIYITNTGQLTRMDAKTQRPIKTFFVGQVGSIFGGFDVLANGNVLIPQFSNNRVVEFDRNGKQVGKPIQVQMPNSAVRLANGHTLVASLNTRTISEFDRSGRQVWTHLADGTVFNVRHR